MNDDDEDDEYVEFEAVMVLPEMTRNYNNYGYDYHVGNALRP